MRRTFDNGEDLRIASWFVVGTNPGQEQLARGFLTSRAWGFDAYLPLIEDLRKVVRPFIPRYLFVADDGRGTARIRNAPGVASLMRGGKSTTEPKTYRLRGEDRVRSGYDLSRQVALPETGVISVGQEVIDEMRGRENDRGLIDLDDDELNVRLGRSKTRRWRKNELFEIRDDAGVAVMRGLFERMRGETRALVFLTRVVHGKEVGSMKAEVGVHSLVSVER